MQRSGNLKLLYYSSNLVMMFLSFLLLMALIGSIIGITRGEDVPIFVPAIFAVLLVLFTLAFRANYFFYVLKRAHKCRIIITDFYNVECLRRFGLNVKDAGEARGYEVCVDNTRIIILPLYIYIPRIFRNRLIVKKAMLHLIPRSIDEEKFKIKDKIKECSGGTL
ncbi:hypothetical protein [Thermococcus sp.]